MITGDNNLRVLPSDVFICIKIFLGRIYVEPFINVFVEQIMTNLVGEGKTEPILVAVLHIHILFDVYYNSGTVTFQICVYLLKLSNAVKRYYIKSQAMLDNMLNIYRYDI